MQERVSAEEIAIDSARRVGVAGVNGPQRWVTEDAKRPQEGGGFLPLTQGRKPIRWCFDRFLELRLLIPCSEGLWMLFRFLDRWGLLAHRHVTARVRALASKDDDLAWGERGLEEQSGKFNSGSWVWEARFTLSKRSSVSSPRMGASRTGQNRGMPQILSREELNVLTVLNQASPEKLHLHELAPRTELEPGSARLLSIVDGLLVRGLIEGKSLRGPEGLADAANLRITGAGTAAVEKSEVEYAAQPTRVPLKPLQASVLNVLIASPSDVGPERDAVESAIHDWNANHYVRSGTMLHPVRWETHSFPSAGGPAARSLKQTNCRLRSLPNRDFRKSFGNADGRSGFRHARRDRTV